MTINELIDVAGAKELTRGVNEDCEIACGYCCDLLSWVMAHGRKGMAWITVQTHMNVIAVATLMEMACVIVPENIAVAQDVLDKAAEEGIRVISSDKTGYELCGLMYRGGVSASK